MLRKLRARIALAALLLLASVISHAAFHVVRVNEVYSNASGTVQFIEIVMLADGQNFFSGQTLSSSQGGPTNSFTFPSNLANGANGSAVLIGTAGYAALSGVPAPDFIVPNGFVFTTNATINFAGVSSVNYASLPTDGTLSLDSNGATATNSPRNNSGASGTVVLTNPGTTPAAPTNLAATPANGQATISFTPGSDGGSPITRFDATCSATFQSTRTGTSIASPIQITGLTNGITYLCSITATNANGTGPSASVNVTPTAPVTVPGAPNIISAAAGDGQVSIVFQPPMSNGGGMISLYRVTCGTAVSSGPSSPIVVTGLPNGITIQCTVAASNSAGFGPESAPINVTAGRPPDAPMITGATTASGQATISFTTPADGGSAITSYGVSCNAGQVIVGGPGSPITITGLTNGTMYSCTVAAINDFGPGPASAPVVFTLPTVPGAPVIGIATPGNTVASIAFTAPASDGGSVITGYTATCNPGPISAGNTVSPISVTGLANGTTYTCSVRAMNALGTGAASGTVTVVPATVPGAPTITGTIPGDGRGAVSFTAPVSNGGSAIISFTATCGGISVTGTASPITVTGLANNMAVDCTVLATNAIGAGTASGIMSVTPSAAAPLTPIAVLARKTHGASGTFDLPLAIAPGPVTSEPRIIGSGHTIVFQFNQAVSATGTASVTPVGAAMATISGFDVVVTLTGIADNQRATVSLTDVNGAGVNVAATLGFLVGDVNNTQSVTAADISGVKARSGQTATGQNFRFDVNATGAISASDISAVKARSGLVLPP